MDERRSYSGWAVSSTLHGALLLFLILGFASAPKFDDGEEAIPVETVSDAQLNQIMNGEKTAKPAPEPPPAPRTEPTPPSPPQPPQPPPELRTADAPEPPQKPEPTPPPKPSRRLAAKPEPAPPPKLADLPTPPERPKPPAAAKARSREAEARPDRQGGRTGERRSQADPRLRSERDRQADRAEGPAGLRRGSRVRTRRRRRRACRTTTRRACPYRWPRRSTHG